MASITIRNLEDDLKRRLRIRAAENGRSMEEEARAILRLVVTETAPPRNLAAAERRAAGRPISQFDCQIAAIARAHGASVATRNTGDYEGCGIGVIDPWDHARAR